MRAANAMIRGRRRVDPPRSSRVAGSLVRRRAANNAWVHDAAAVARLTALDAVQFATEETIQLHGGIGFTWDADPHLFLRRGWQLKADLGPAAMWRERLLGHLADAQGAAS